MSTIIGKSPTSLPPHTPNADQESSSVAKPLKPEFEIPDEPLVTIQPGRSWSALDPRDLWVYRELLYFLMWRDLKVRYKQTFFGVAWVVMQPLLMTLIFTVFLGMLARVPSGGVPYPLLVYIGLLPWMFFSASVSICSNSLIANANLITKVYFPRVLVPAAAVGAKLVDLGISFVILICLILYYKFIAGYPIEPTWNLAYLPLLIVLTTLLTFGLGTLTAALNVKYRDVGMALPVMIQLWMFISPVLYSSDLLVPPQWRRIYALNPLVGIVEGFRAALLGGKLNLFALMISVVFTIAIVICTAYSFRHVEKSFADVI